MKVKKRWSFHYRFLYRGDLCVKIPYSIMYSNLMSLVRSLVWSGHTVYSNRQSHEKMTSSAKRRFRTWKPSSSGRHSTLGSIFHQHGKSRKFRHMQKTYQKWPEIQFSHESLDNFWGGSSMQIPGPSSSQFRKPSREDPGKSLTSSSLDLLGLKRSLETCSWDEASNQQKLGF